VLIGGIVAAVVIAGVVVGVLLRQRSHDDAHSVEHYHRKLHTLEEMRAHPAGVGLREGAVAGSSSATEGGVANGNGSAAGDEHSNSANCSGTAGVVEAPAEREAAGAGGAGAYPASALRVSGSPAVRLTDAVHAPAPPAPPPPVASLSKPERFDDEGPGSMPGTFMSGNDRAMDSINHRPRRFGGPLAAIAAVAVLVVVLIVTGMHTTAPTSSHSRPRAGTHTSPPASHPSVTSTTVPARQAPVTSTTVPPVVSAPSGSSASGATYTVSSANYALALSATSGPCWIQVTDTSTGAVLFSTTLYGGQSHTVTAAGPVTVVAGAPSAFSATVNGTPVTLPASYQAPFTLTFQTSASGSG